MADYGAEVDGVRRLLPEVTIDGSSSPSEDDVAIWLAEFTGEVARRLGDVSSLDAGVLVELDVAAKRLVHFAAAATTYDAHFPERAGLTDQSYGNVLWTRYKEGLDQLDSEVAALTGVSDVDVPGDATAVPLFSFPTPAFLDDFYV